MMAALMAASMAEMKVSMMVVLRVEKKVETTDAMDVMMVGNLDVTMVLPMVES
jgi:hypothetical protein